MVKERVYGNPLESVTHVGEEYMKAFYFRPDSDPRDQEEYESALALGDQERINKIGELLKRLARIYSVWVRIMTVYYSPYWGSSQGEQEPCSEVTVILDFGDAPFEAEEDIRHTFRNSSEEFYESFGNPECAPAVFVTGTMTTKVIINEVF